MLIHLRGCVLPGGSRIENQLPHFRLPGKREIQFHAAVLPGKGCARRDTLIQQAGIHGQVIAGHREAQMRQRHVVVLNRQCRLRRQRGWDITDLRNPRLVRHSILLRHQQFPTKVYGWDSGIGIHLHRRQTDGNA